jgi:hypothetical protein
VFTLWGMDIAFSSLQGHTYIYTILSMVRQLQTIPFDISHRKFKIVSDIKVLSTAL